MLLGVAAKLPLIWAANRLLSGLFYAPSRSSATAIIASIAMMIATGLAAAWLPARRATRVDPLTALRTD